MQITIQDCFCKEFAGGLQTVHARFKGSFDNAPGNADTWRTASCLLKNKSRCLMEAAGHEFRQCGLVLVGEILDADHAAVFIEAIDDRRSGAQFTLQDFFR